MAVSALLKHVVPQPVADQQPNFFIKKKVTNDGQGGELL